MKINIKATGITLTPAISEYVDKKISSVEKHLLVDPAADTTAIVAQVEVGMTTHHHRTGEIFKAEVHITGLGLDLYASTEKEDLYAAIDILRDEIVHEATQYKGKKKTLTRRSAEAVKNLLKRLGLFN